MKNLKWKKSGLVTRTADAQDLIQQLKEGETFIPRKKKEEPPTVIEPEEDSNQGTECNFFLYFD